MSDESKKGFLDGSQPKHTFLLGLFIGIAIISFTAFIVVLIFMSNSGVRAGDASDKSVVAADREAATPPPANEPIDDDFVAPLPQVTADDHVEGPADAKVTVIVYDDFECPFCANFHPALKQAREEYRGKVRFVIRHFPLSFHPKAQPAAEASECAAEQGKFWEYADALFENQDSLGNDLYKKLAGDLGLNASKFNDCLTSGKYTQKIRNQMSAGAAAGVKGTPASFINGELVSGAVPYETLKTVIDSKL